MTEYIYIARKKAAAREELTTAHGDRHDAKVWVENHVDVDPNMDEEAYWRQYNKLVYETSNSRVYGTIEQIPLAETVEDPLVEATKEAEVVMA